MAIFFNLKWMLTLHSLKEVDNKNGVNFNHAFNMYDNTSPKTTKNEQQVLLFFGVMVLT